ncbi:MAG: GIY-YIG nuclease family protein [Balneolaceae bacterium]
MGFIYKIINKTNNKIYIGQTKLSIEQRWKKHIKDSKLDKIKDRPLYRAINKYGLDNFQVEKIEECPDELLNEREIFHILENKSLEEGYNLTKGGDGGSTINFDKVIQMYNVEELSIHQISLITGYARSSISSCLRKENIEIRQIIVNEDLIIKKYLSGDSIYKINKDTGHTKTTISKILKNNNIEITTTNRSKPVVQKKLNGEIILEFKSVKAAQRHLKETGQSKTLNLTHLINCLKGRTEIYCGCKWEYK